MVVEEHLLGGPIGATEYDPLRTGGEVGDPAPAGQRALPREVTHNAVRITYSPIEKAMCIVNPWTDGNSAQAAIGPSRHGARIRHRMRGAPKEPLVTGENGRALAEGTSGNPGTGGTGSGQLGVVMADRSNGTWTGIIKLGSGALAGPEVLSGHGDQPPGEEEGDVHRRRE